MIHRRSLILMAATAALLAACGGPVRRVSEPTASIQQLTVNADGSWKVDLRLQNYSSIPMRFDSVKLQITVNTQDAGTLTGNPAISIGPESADLVSLTFAPTGMAKIGVADALSGRHALPYTLKGTVMATPEEANKARSFELDVRNTLNPVPGLDGVLR